MASLAGVGASSTGAQASASAKSMSDSLREGLSGPVATRDQVEGSGCDSLPCPLGTRVEEKDAEMVDILVNSNKRKLDSCSEEVEMVKRHKTIISERVDWHAELTALFAMKFSSGANATGKLTPPDNQDLPPPIKRKRASKKSSPPSNVDPLAKVCGTCGVIADSAKARKCKGCKKFFSERVAKMCQPLPRCPSCSGKHRRSKSGPSTCHHCGYTLLPIAPSTSTAPSALEPVLCRGEESSDTASPSGSSDSHSSASLSDVIDDDDSDAAFVVGSPSPASGGQVYEHKGEVGLPSRSLRAEPGHQTQPQLALPPWPQSGSKVSYANVMSGGSARTTARVVPPGTAHVQCSQIPRGSHDGTTASSFRSGFHSSPSIHDGTATSSRSGSRASPVSCDGTTDSSSRSGSHASSCARDGTASWSGSHASLGSHDGTVASSSRSSSNGSSGGRDVIVVSATPSVRQSPLLLDLPGREHKSDSRDDVSCPGAEHYSDGKSVETENPEEGVQCSPAAARSSCENPAETKKLVDVKLSKRKQTFSRKSNPAESFVRLEPAMKALTSRSPAQPYRQLNVKVRVLDPSPSATPCSSGAPGSLPLPPSSLPGLPSQRTVPEFSRPYAPPLSSSQYRVPGSQVLALPLSAAPSSFQSAQLNGSSGQALRTLDSPSDHAGEAVQHLGVTYSQARSLTSPNSVSNQGKPLIISRYRSPPPLRSTTITSASAGSALSVASSGLLSSTAAPVSIPAPSLCPTSTYSSPPMLVPSLAGPSSSSGRISFSPYTGSGIPSVIATPIVGARALMPREACPISRSSSSPPVEGTPPALQRTDKGSSTTDAIVRATLQLITSSVQTRIKQVLRSQAEAAHATPPTTVSEDSVGVNQLSFSCADQAPLKDVPPNAASAAVQTSPEQAPPLISRNLADDPSWQREPHPDERARHDPLSPREASYVDDPSGKSVGPVRKHLEQHILRRQAGTTPCHFTSHGVQVQVISSSGSRLAGELGSRPSGELGSRPFGEHSYRSIVEHGSRPLGEYSSRPIGEHGSILTGKHGSNPIDEHGSKLIREHSSRPIEEHGSLPTREYDTKLIGEHGSEAIGGHTSRLFVELDSRPAAEYGSRLAREHGFRQAREHGSRPAGEYSSRPAREHGSRPAREHGSRPAKELGSARTLALGSSSALTQTKEESVQASPHFSQAIYKPSVRYRTTNPPSGRYAERSHNSAYVTAGEDSQGTDQEIEGEAAQGGGGGLRLLVLCI